MSIQMDRKDYVAEGGSVASVSGGSALLSDILFRLSARRGGFVLLPEFGSRMHLLRHEKPSARAALARQYAVEALAELTDVEVTDAAVTAVGEGLLVQVELCWQGEPLAVELEV
jgi:phage gp46-like protein